jgi:hypothetical protein
MSFWLRRRLTASNSSLDESRGWWVSTNSTSKPSSGSALEEMDDLSKKAVKLVIEYCLEVLEEVEKIVRGKATLARLEAALNVQYADRAPASWFGAKRKISHLDTILELEQMGWEESQSHSRNEPLMQGLKRKGHFSDGTAEGAELPCWLMDAILTCFRKKYRKASRLSKNRRNSSPALQP